MEKTIKEMADELGVDKQRVYRFLVRSHITASSEVMRTKRYDEAAQTLVKSAFQCISDAPERCSDVHQNRITDAPGDTPSDAVISALLEELKEKNKQLAAQADQIRDLHSRLSEITAALVSAQQTAQAAQALHAGTIHQLTQPSDVSIEDPSSTSSPSTVSAQKKHWWWPW